MINPKIVAAYKTAKAKLLEQNQQALSEKQTCKYENHLGHRCIVGWMLDSKLTDLTELLGSIKNANIRLLLVESLGIENLTNTDLEFLLEAQGIHDTCSPHQWVKEFMLLEKHYKITA